MPSTMYALVDCNNFYVSCERLFNPKLRNRPVIVISNNDGCAVSRSNEAKQIGIAMGEPLFKMRDLIRKHDVAVLSSNFALYGDLSARIMSIITHNMPDVVIYSVDEAFIDLTSLQGNFDIYKLCTDLVMKIERYTGIPVSIGIASSKTLAKVANNVAKKQNTPGRVMYLDSAEKTNLILNEFDVRGVWGIGRQTEKKLHAMGVQTATDLINLPESTIEKSFHVGMQRTILELQGVSCIELKDNTLNKQQIMVSRSFAHRVTTLEQLQEALATYASLACEKLRSQNSIAHGVQVFLHTGLHGAAETIYRNSMYIDLPSPSFDTRVITQHANVGLKQLFKHGYRYQKVGIILCGLTDAEHMQIDLFGDMNLAHSTDLMNLMDNINKKLGKTTVQFAAAGLEKPWQIKTTMRSDRYTSNWLELPKVSLNSSNSGT